MKTLAIIILTGIIADELIALGYYAIGGHPLPKKPVVLWLLSGIVEVAAILLCIAIL